MSTGSLSTCRAAGWMKIDRETKAVEGQEGRERERGRATFSVWMPWREEAEKGVARGGARTLEVAEHRVLIAPSGVLA